MDGDPTRILIINPFGIGDVLFTTPLIRALKRAFPHSRVSYLCNRRTEHVLQGNPHIDRLVIYEKSELERLWSASKRECVASILALLGQLKQGRFDLVIDLSLGERYSLILRFCGASRQVGFNYRQRGRFLSESLPIDGYHAAHVVEYYRHLLEFIGVQMLDPSLELHPSQEDAGWADAWLRARGLDGAKMLVGLVPAGGVSWGGDAPFRRWSDEGFAAVGDRLVERHGARVLLFGEASDRAACQAVATRMRHVPIDVSGQTSLGQFVSLLGRLDLVLCNDGGPLHMAVSQGVRTVSIFGPVDPHVYGPYAPTGPRHRVVCREDLPCRPCYHQFKLPPCPYERACLRELSVDAVLEACEASLGERMPLSPA